MKIASLFGSLSLLLAGTAAAQDPSLERLEQSPRHHEWVTVPQGDRAVHAFVAYPEAEDSAPAVIVIHENRGSTTGCAA